MTDSFEQFDRRSQRRRRLRVSATVVLAGGTFIVRTIDIGPKGLSFATDLRLNQGLVLRINFVLPVHGHGHSLKLEGQVMNQVLSPGEGFRTGLSFQTTSADDDKAIELYVAT